MLMGEVIHDGRNYGTLENHAVAEVNVLHDGRYDVHLKSMLLFKSKSN